MVESLLVAHLLDVDVTPEQFASIMERALVVHDVGSLRGRPDCRRFVRNMLGGLEDAPSARLREQPVLDCFKETLLLFVMLSDVLLFSPGFDHSVLATRNVGQHCFIVLLGFTAPMVKDHVASIEELEKMSPASLDFDEALMVR